MLCQAVGGGSGSGSGTRLGQEVLRQRRRSPSRSVSACLFLVFKVLRAQQKAPAAGGKMLSRTSAAFCLFVVGIAIIIPGRAQRNPSGNATLFEGARLIAGDGSAAIESAAFVVENGRFSSVGRKGQIQAPPNATRIDLTGKTVMPAMVDVHSHFGFLNQRDGSMSKANFNRQNLIEHLQRYAYHGFAAAISMGTDFGELPYQLREEVHPGAALFRTVGRGLAWPGSGPNDAARNDVPYVVTTVDQARQAVRDLAPHQPDL